MGTDSIDGWQRHWDMFRKQYSYLNIITGETVWSSPSKDWIRRNSFEKFCDKPKRKSHDGPVLHAHDPFILLTPNFDIDPSANIVEGVSDVPEDCCHYCFMENACFGFVHVDTSCYLKKEGGQILISNNNLASSGKVKSLKTIGIRLK